MPACVTRMMGPARGDEETASVHEKLLSLFSKSGYEVIYPEVRTGCSCAPISTFTARYHRPAQRSSERLRRVPPSQAKMYRAVLESAATQSRLPQNAMQ